MRLYTPPGGTRSRVRSPKIEGFVGLAGEQSSLTGRPAGQQTVTLTHPLSQSGHPASPSPANPPRSQSEASHSKRDSWRARISARSAAPFPEHLTVKGLQVVFPPPQRLRGTTSSKQNMPEVHRSQLKLLETVQRLRARLRFRRAFGARRGFLSAAAGPTTT